MTDDDPGAGPEHAASELPSVGLVEAVAAAKGVDPIALDPVGGTVDLDALDALLQSSPAGQDVAVTVEFQDVRAEVDSCGSVTVRQTGSGAAGADP